MATSNSGLRLTINKASVNDLKNELNRIIKELENSCEIELNLDENKFSKSINIIKTEMNKINSDYTKIKIGADDKELKSMIGQVRATKEEMLKMFSEMGQVKIGRAFIDKDGIERFTIELKRIDGLMEKIRIKTNALQPSGIENKPGKSLSYIVDNTYQYNLMDRSQEKLLEKMAKGRESAEIKAREEIKKTEEAQAKAINCAIELQKKEEEAIEKKTIAMERQVELTRQQIALRMKTLNQRYGEDATGELQEKLSNVIGKSKNANNQIVGFDRALAIKEINGIIKDFEKTTLPLSRQNKFGDFIGNFSGSTRELKQFVNELNGYGSRITKIKTETDNYGGSLVKLTSEMRNNNGSVSTLEHTYDSLTKSIYKGAESTKTMGTSLSEIGNRIKSSSFGTTGSFIAGQIGFAGINAATNSIRDGVSTVIELDKAATNIKMITQKSDSEVKGLMDSYIQKAKELKQAIPDVIASGEAFLRAGLNEKEAMDMVTNSMKLSTIAQQDSKTTSTQLLAVMNTYYGNETDAIKKREAMVDVVNKLAKADMVSASSSKEISAALLKTSESAKQAGVDLTELMSISATLNDRLQQSGSSIGTALNQIFSRWTSVKTGKKFDADNEDLSNVESSLRKYGNINLRSDKGTIKDFGKVIDELKVKWKDLSEVQQDAISSAVAGTRQKQQFLVLMENYSMVKKMNKELENSSGYADKAYSEYTKGLEAKIKVFKNTISELQTKMLKSETLGSILDSITKIITTLTSSSGLFTKLANEIAYILKIISQISPETMNLAIKIGIATFAFSKLLGIMSIGIQTFNALKTIVAGGQMFTMLTASLGGVTTKTGTLVTVLGGLFNVLKNVGMAITGVNTTSFFGALGVGAVGAVPLAIAIAGIIDVVDQYKKRQQDLVKEQTKVKKSIEDTTTSIKNLNEAMKTNDKTQIGSTLTEAKKQDISGLHNRKEEAKGGINRANHLSDLAMSNNANLRVQSEKMLQEENQRTGQSFMNIGAMTQYYQERLEDCTNAERQLVNELQNKGYSITEISDILGGLNITQAENALKNIELSDSLSQLQQQEQGLTNEIGYLNSTMDYLSNNNLLNAQQVSELINKYPSLTESVRQQGDMYTIEGGALENLRNIKIDEMNTCLNAESTKSQQVAMSVTERMGAYGAEISKIQDLASAQAAIANINDQLNYNLDRDPNIDPSLYSRDKISVAEEEKILSLGRTMERINGMKNLIQNKNYGVSGGARLSGGGGGYSPSNSSGRGGGGDSAKKSAQELEQAQQQANQKVNNLLQNLMEAYKNYLEKQKKAEIESIKQREKAEEDYLNSKIKTLQDKIKALQDTEKDDTDKLNELKKQLALWKNDDSTVSLRKQKELQKEIGDLEKEMQIKSYNKEIDKLEEEKQKKKKEFDLEEERVNKKYEESMSERNVYEYSKLMYNNEDIGRMEYFLNNFGGKINSAFKSTGELIAQEIRDALDARGLASKAKVKRFATGGYTGDNEGMAYLDKKEIVLNSMQTSHLLETVKALESMNLKGYSSMIGKAQQISNITNNITTNNSFNINNDVEFISNSEWQKENTLDSFGKVIKNACAIGGINFKRR